VIDLKLDHFKVGYKGQMKLYLKWPDKQNEKKAKGHHWPSLCRKTTRTNRITGIRKGDIRALKYLTLSPLKGLLA